MARPITLDDLIEQQGLAGLITWLRAQLDQEELAAVACGGTWTARPYVYGPPEEGWGDPPWEIIDADGKAIVDHQPHEGGGISREAVARHIEQYDPARALADIRVKRLMLFEIEHALAAQLVPVDGHGPLIAEPLAEDLVRTLVWPYGADQQGWIDLDRGVV